MATLQGQTIAGSYKDLLQVSNSNSGVDTTARAVEDGEGTATLLYLSTTEVYSPGTGGTSNTAFGKNAGDALTTNGNYNVVIGEEAGTALTTGVANVAMGFEALDASQTSDFCVAIGHQALTDNTTDGETANTAVGYKAGAALVGGDSNTIVGFEAGKQSTAGTNMTIMGRRAGYDVITSASAGFVGYGYEAGFSLLSGAGNTALGYRTLKNNEDGDFNTAVGHQALETFEADADGHGNNTAVGYNAGNAISTGTENTCIGATAGATGSNNLTTGDNCTLIGNSTAVSASGADNQTVIGNGATGVANASVTLGNAGVTAIYAAQDSGAVVHAAGMKFDGDQTNNVDEANTLDDYEEGTQVVTLGAGTGTLSLLGSKNEGQYTKIGRMVHYSGEISCNGSSSPTSIITFTLPFTVSDIADLAERTVGTCSIQNSNFPDAWFMMHMNTYAGQSVMTITGVTDNGAWANMQADNWASGTEMVWSISYICA